MDDATVGNARAARKLQPAPNGATARTLRPRTYSPPSVRGLRCVRRRGRPPVGAKGRCPEGLEPRRTAQLVFAFLEHPAATCEARASRACSSSSARAASRCVLELELEPRLVRGLQ